MAQKILYKIRVTGLVQGVGFRWSTAREARSRNITGYVKNMSDGSVFIEAEGTEEQLNKFVEWCRRGPGMVDSVTTEIFPPVGYTDFGVEY